MDPKLPDTDRDGLPDFDELNTYFTNATHNDTDHDGLIDGTEINLGTNVINSDSDGDGYSDGEEIAAGTDPLNSSDYPGKTTPTDYLSIIVIIILAIVIGALG